LSTFGIVLLALFFSPSESSDGDLWPSDWHFRVQLHRYSDRYCKDKVSKHQLLKAGHCLGKHPFTSLAYRVGKHMNYEKDWAKYGNCTLHTYEQPNCEGRELAFVPRVSHCPSGALSVSFRDTAVWIADDIGAGE